MDAITLLFDQSKKSKLKSKSKSKIDDIGIGKRNWKQIKNRTNFLNAFIIDNRKFAPKSKTGEPVALPLSDGDYSVWSVDAMTINHDITNKDKVYKLYVAFGSNTHYLRCIKISYLKHDNKDGISSITLILVALVAVIIIVFFFKRVENDEYNQYTNDEESMIEFDDICYIDMNYGKGVSISVDVSIDGFLYIWSNKVSFTR